MGEAGRERGLAVVFDANVVIASLPRDFRIKDCYIVILAPVIYLSY